MPISVFRIVSGNSVGSTSGYGLGVSVTARATSVGARLSFLLEGGVDNQSAAVVLRHGLRSRNSPSAVGRQRGWYCDPTACRVETA